MAAYYAFLLSDKYPRNIIDPNTNDTLEKLVSASNGEFIFNDFNLIKELDKDINPDEELKKLFDKLFEHLRFKINVIFLDLEFLNRLFILTEVHKKYHKEYLHKYLISIFAVSYMSAKSSDCKYCKHRNNYEKAYMHYIVLINPSKKDDIYIPDFLDWLRLKDDVQKTFEKSIITPKENLPAFLAHLKSRFEFFSQEGNNQETNNLIYHIASDQMAFVVENRCINCMYHLEKILPLFADTMYKMYINWDKTRSQELGA